MYGLISFSLIFPFSHTLILSYCHSPILPFSHVRVHRTLYCAKGNYEFGVTRIMKSLEPYNKKVCIQYILHVHIDLHTITFI